MPIKQLAFRFFDPTPFDAALEALNRLNSWVRSASYEPMCSGPKAAIYRHKDLAIRELHARGLTRHRAIAVESKCHRCHKGVYFDYDGYERGPCWTCGGTCKVTLRFVETYLPAGLCWHSPMDRFPLSRTEAGLRDPVFPESAWRPRQPGRDLSPIEVARDLLAVERTWPIHDRYGDLSEYRYRLWVGMRDPATCSICGGQNDSGYRCHSCSSGRIAWGDHACNACLKRRDVWDLFQVPADLIAPPEIAEWIASRESLAGAAVA